MYGVGTQTSYQASRSEKVQRSNVGGEGGGGSAALLGDDVGEMRLVKPNLIATISLRPRGAKTTSLGDRWALRGNLWKSA
eukprot:COSAG04_NODE_4405_length_2116_cov_287.982152_2_plen_80_part_00